LVGLEQGEPYLAYGFEEHLDAHADVERLEPAADDVGREAEPGLFIELDEADDVQAALVGTPFVPVDRVGEELTSPADVLGCDVGCPACAADRGGRVEVQAATLAAQDLEPSGGSRLPEEGRLGMK